MHRVFRLKPHLVAASLEPGGLFFISEQERRLLKGRAIERVVPLIDGRRSVLELISELRGEVAPPEVVYAINQLADAGYISDSPPDRSLEEEAFWDCLGLGERDQERLRSARVGVDGFGEGARFRDAAIEALEAASVVVDDQAPLRLVLTDDYLHPDLAAFNHRSIAEGSSWMLLKPVGSSPWIGPIFRPGAGPCWQCLAYRVIQNRPVESFLQRRLGNAAPPHAPIALLRSVAHAAVGLGVSSLAHWIARGAGGLDDTLWSLAPAPLGLKEHAVVRRPQCSVCGDPELVKKRLLAPLALEPRPKRYTEDGGHRCMAPADTLRRLRHQVSPITGIVANMGPIPDRNHPLRPVFGATTMVCPNTSAPASGDFVRASMGKGRTVAQAEAGALCEAMERASATFQGDEPILYASVDELGSDALDPGILQNFSAAQYRHRAEANTGILGQRGAIPPPFNPAVPIAWLPAWSLTRQRRRYLPAAFSYLNVPTQGEATCVFSSNGHAAGNCLEEAILQGMLELAERDAVAIWWYNRLRRPGVDLASFREPYLLDLAAHYVALGHPLWVLDVTNDLGIPSFAALARSRETGRFSVGFGSHFDPRLGVQRALTEVNQTFDPAGSARGPWDNAWLRDLTFLFPDDAVPARTRDAFAYEAHTDLVEDIAAFVSTAASVGLETIVQDQTRPDFGLSVAKVVVPGLRHIWPRLGPGRLYDVPVKMGWLPAPKEETELNPVPLHL